MGEVTKLHADIEIRQIPHQHGSTYGKNRIDRVLSVWFCTGRIKTGQGPTIGLH